MSRNVVLPNIFLKAYGYWVFDRTDCWPYRFHRVFCIPIFIVGFSLLEIVHLLESILNNADINRITEALAHAVNHILGVIKQLIMYKHSRSIQSIYENCIQDDRVVYEETEHFDRMKLIDESMIMSVKATLGMYTMGFVFFAFGYSAPFKAETKTFMGSDNVTMYTTRTLPFNTYVPFDEGLLPNYYFVFLYQGISMTDTALMIAAFDIMFYGILGQMAVQFKILGQAIGTIKERTKEIVLKRMKKSTLELQQYRAYEDEFREEMLRQLEKCIIHHQFIIQACTNIQTIYNYVMLFQFGTTMAVICVSMFQCLMRTGSSFEFLYMIFYALTITVELFNYCWFGKEVTSESERVPAALMSAYWPGAPARYSSNYRFFLLRSQKPMMFRALGVFPLDLVTFGSIMKGAYSYLSVLKPEN